MNLILVGFRGAGKSTVGPILAKRLGWRFIDLDEMIVQKAGRSIREIFAQEGEAGFRQRERAAMESLRKVRRHVVSLGGGALNEPENRALAKRLGKIVWLTAPAAVLWARVARDAHSARNRPDLTPGGGLAEFETMLAQREAGYQSMANHIVDTVSCTAEEVVDAIELWFEANDTDAHS